LANDKGGTPESTEIIINDFERRYKEFTPLMKYIAMLETEKYFYRNK